MGRYWGQEVQDSRGWEESSPRRHPMPLCRMMQEVSELALDGLKQVMAIKSRVVLPYLPCLLQVPTRATPSGPAAIAT